MRSYFIFLFACLFSINSYSAESPNEPPNILLIVADDLGYSDLGRYGSEIPTPNLDMLANEGLLLTNFYTSMLCAVTRSMLLSGTDNHLAGLGAMGGHTEAQLGQPGYEQYLNFSVASLADLMTDAGYNTYMTGKWHLGLTEETSPAARGMKRSFTLLEGGAAHLGGMTMWGPEASGSEFAFYRDDMNLVTVDEDFYSTREYTDRMISFIEADREDDKPFFAYLAYTAPHWPLQAPAESIAKFKGLYDDGYEALHHKRFERLGEMGLLPEGALVADSSRFDPTWDSLSAEEQAIESRGMEVYAALVSDLDIYIGKLIDYLKSIDEYENTFIMFMSDNGAEGVKREAGNGPFARWAARCCDNSLENIGSVTSYVSYGPNWAVASATPWQRHKTSAFEGGIHVPAFIHYSGLESTGAQNNAFATVMDLLPTFLDLAETEHPGAVYKGREVFPVKGNSMLPILTGESEFVHAEDEYMGWEHRQHSSIRQGDWKIVWDPTMGLEAKWQLFNLAEDPSERNDLIEVNPEKASELLILWGRYLEENGVIF